jgi:DNA invertase Pin-like site-specific DNA recombinase
VTFTSITVARERERAAQSLSAIAALHASDTLVITTLDCLGHSTANMLELADRLRGLGVSLKVLKLGGDAVASTPIGSMLFTVVAALAQMELDAKRERINDSVSRRGAAGLDLGGRSQKFTRSQLEKARQLIDACKPVPTSAATSVCPAPPSTDASPRYLPSRPGEGR